MNITVAKATDLQDVAAMLTEYQETLEPVPTINQEKNTRFLQQILDDESLGTIFIGRTSSNQPAAFALICRRLSSPDADWVPYISDLYVRETFRRHGFGRQLFDHIVRWARSRSIPQIRWQVENLNLTAQYMFDAYNPEVTGWVGYALDLGRE